MSGDGLLQGAFEGFAEEIDQGLTGSKAFLDVGQVDRQATLGGTLSVAASRGVTTFSNLTINKIGSGYTLRVISSGLSSASAS